MTSTPTTSAAQRARTEEGVAEVFRQVGDLPTRRVLAHGSGSLNQILHI